MVRLKAKFEKHGRIPEENGEVPILPTRQEKRTQNQDPRGVADPEGLHGAGKIRDRPRVLKRRVDPTRRLQNVLWVAIDKNRPRGTMHAQSFLAESQIDEIIRVESVEQELSRSHGSRTQSLIQKIWKFGDDTKTDLKPEATRNLAEQICGRLEHTSTDRPLDHSKAGANPSSNNFRKIFAILTLIDLSHRIDSFVNQGVSDQDLPLTFKMIDIKSSKAWRLYLNSGNEISSVSFKEPEWNQDSIEKFQERQWSMLAPVFSLRPGTAQTLAETPCSEKVILPFTSYEPLEQRRGSSCRVIKVKIHPHHHDFQKYENPGTSSFFAVKQLNSCDKDTFLREVAVLRRFNDNRPHLISLLATYKRQGLYHLVFPWAEADLCGFWREVKPQVLLDERDDVFIWMTAQCQGITDGLSQIHYHRTLSGRSLLRAESIPKIPHNRPQSQSSPVDSRFSHVLFGRHGDIKPENILFFPHIETSGPNGFGTLKIADFGIAEFSTQTAVDGSRRGFAANSPSYRAPEADLPHDDGIIRLSFSYDIWALGCVFLEFVTWWFGGWKLVKDFNSKRASPDVIFYGHAALEVDAFFSDTFFRISKNPRNEDVPIVKESVSEFIRELQERPPGTKCTTEFLRIISEDMLIAQANRKSCNQIVQTLCEMRKKACWPPYWPSSSRPTSPASIEEEAEAHETSTQSLLGKSDLPVLASMPASQQHEMGEDGLTGTE